MVQFPDEINENILGPNISDSKHIWFKKSNFQNLCANFIDRTNLELLYLSSFRELFLQTFSQPCLHIIPFNAIPHLLTILLSFRFRATLPKEDEANPTKIEAAFKKFCKPLKLKENRYFQTKFTHLSKIHGTFSESAIFK